MLSDDNGGDARTAKRARFDRPAVSTNVAHWIELARLLTEITGLRIAKLSRTSQVGYPRE